MSTAVSKINTWMGGKSPFNVEYGKLMMWLFLVSDAFTFGGLLITYGATRFATTSWPDPNNVFNAFPGLHGHFPLLFVSLMTFVLIISSVTMVLAVQAGQRGDKKEVVKYLILTIAGGLVFLGCQAWEWAHLYHEGAWWGHNPFPNQDGTLSSPNFTNFFFTITGFHGFHVTTGVIINIIMLIMTLKNVFEKRHTYQMIEKAGLYWHFVDLVWVFVFTFFYLV